VWDPGTLNEHILPGGYQGAYMFSVPHEAMPGTHTVVLQHGSDRSAPYTFTIPMPPGPDDVPRPRGQPHEFPAPRIDAVTIVGASFDTAGVNSTLYVQGANLDVGATIWIKDSPTAPPVEVATTSHRVLRNDWFGVSHSDLDYPIYHYSSSIAIAGVRMPGQHLWIVAKNLGGAESPPFEYVLPADAKTLDSDGDSLPDVWETSGYDAEMDGTVEVDLKTLGADPYRRDIFLELDIMDEVQHRPDRDEKGNPSSAVFDELRKMFEAAPILNIGDARGINLVIDTSTDKPCLMNPAGMPVCSFTTTVFNIGGQLPKGEEEDPFTTDTILFSRLKEHGFDDRKRGKVFHYAVWAIQQDNGRSGWSDDDADNQLAGDDLVITFDNRVDSYHTTRSQIESIAHELGHNLLQRHGGKTDNPERKPNYLSVMSYSWLHRTAWSDGLRLDRATCLPFYYAKPGAMDVMSGSGVPDVNTVVDYSEGMAKTLIRPTPAAGGSAYFCGMAINWATVTPLSANTIEDFANWRALVFDGPAKNGILTP